MIMLVLDTASMAKVLTNKLEKIFQSLFLYEVELSEISINKRWILNFTNCERCILYTETYALIRLSSTSYHLQPQHAFMQKLRFILSDVTIAVSL